MTTDKDDSRYKGNSENRSDNSSSNYRNDENTQGSLIKKKRPRVGDVRVITPRTSGQGSNNNYNSPSTSSNNRSYDRSPMPNRDSYDRNSGSDRNYNRSSSGYSDRNSNSGGGGYRSNNNSYGNNNNSYGNSGNSYGNNNNRGNSSYSPRRSNDNSGYNKRPMRGSNNNNNNNNRRFGPPNNDSSAPRKIVERKKILIRPVKYKENLDPDTPLRLNKYLANAGVCSRREADTYITSGIVKVNGVVVSELGAKVKRGDTVTFNERSVTLESKIYVLLNKPKNCVTTSDDPQDRKTVMDLVKNACTERIYPVGRLDRNTTGVLLLTNDGDLASKLMHPKFKKKKTYQVGLDKDVTIEDMQAIADGVELDDGEIHADSIAYVGEDILNEVGIEIHSGRNRVVRRIFEKLGYQVTKLDRVYFAGLTKKNLQRGRWRYLTEKEVNMLRMGAYE